MLNTNVASTSYMAYYIQTGDMSTVCFFSPSSLNQSMSRKGSAMDRQRWKLRGKHVWFYQLQRENMPGVDGRTVCLPAEGESTRDGQTAGVASLRMVQIALSLRIPVTSLPTQHHKGWLCFVTMYVWGKHQFNVKPTWAKAVHYHL